jgi:hypothetical protein
VAVPEVVGGERVVVALPTVVVVGKSVTGSVSVLAPPEQPAANIAPAKIYARTRFIVFGVALTDTK